MSNYALNDPSLSLKAKGLWAFIMTKPDGWKITSRGLAGQLKEGRDSILGGLNELEDGGYLIRGEQRSYKGKFSTSDATLYETPNSVDTVTGKPTTDYPTTENPTVLVNTNIVNTNKDINGKQLLEIVNEVIGRNFRTLPSTGWKKTLKMFTLEEIRSALVALRQDEWHSPRLKTLSIDYLTRPTVIDKFLDSEEKGSIGWD